MMVFEFSGNFCTAMHVVNRVFSSSASGLPLIFVMYSAVLSSLGTSLIIFLTCSSVPRMGVACGAVQGNHSEY